MRFQPSPYSSPYASLPSSSGSPQVISQATSLLRLLGLNNANSPLAQFALQTAAPNPQFPSSSAYGFPQTPAWPGWNVQQPQAYGGWTGTPPSGMPNIEALAIPNKIPVPNFGVAPQYGQWIDPARALYGQPRVQVTPEQLERWQSFLMPQGPSAPYQPMIAPQTLPQPQIAVPNPYGQGVLRPQGYGANVLEPSGSNDFFRQIMLGIPQQPATVPAQPRPLPLPLPPPGPEPPIDNTKAVYGVYPLHYGTNYISPLYTPGGLYYGLSQRRILIPRPVLQAPVPVQALPPLPPPPPQALLVGPRASPAKPCISTAIQNSLRAAGKPIVGQDCEEVEEEKKVDTSE